MEGAEEGMIGGATRGAGMGSPTQSLLDMYLSGDGIYDPSLQLPDGMENEYFYLGKSEAQQMRVKGENGGFQSPMSPFEISNNVQSGSSAPSWAKAEISESSSYVNPASYPVQTPSKRRRAASHRGSPAKKPRPSGSNSPAQPPTSMFRGVSFKRTEGKWVSQIKYKGKQHYLGIFHTEEDAARAYDAKARQFYGDLAGKNGTNFPSDEVARSKCLEASRRNGTPMAELDAEKKPPTSNYRGVSYKTKDHKYVAQIRCGRTQYYLGIFETEHEAAVVYDFAALRFHGARAKLNFAASATAMASMGKEPAFTSISDAIAQMKGTGSTSSLLRDAIFRANGLSPRKATQVLEPEGFPFPDDLKHQVPPLSTGAERSKPTITTPLDTVKAAENMISPMSSKSGDTCLTDDYSTAEYSSAHTTPSNSRSSTPRSAPHHVEESVFSFSNGANYIAHGR